MAKPIFPPIFLQRTPKSHWEAVSQYAAQYDAGIASRTYTPFTYPGVSLGALILFLFLLVPPTSFLHSKSTRYATFAVTTYWHIWLIRNCKSFNPAVGFGIGIVCCWGILWTATILIFHDSKVEFKRVVRQDLLREHDGSASSLDGGSGSSSTTTEHKGESTGVGDKVDLHNRKSLSSNSSTTSMNGDAKHHNAMSSPSSPQKPLYTWQSYPAHPIKQRLDWTIDLITNFRGAGWSWKVPGLPSYPSHIQSALTPISSAAPSSLDIMDQPISRSGIRRFDTYWSLVLHNMWLVTKGYIAIDALMTVMNHDPYFWGMVNAAPPAYYPFSLVRGSFLLTRMYRLVISMCAVWMGLRTIFAWAPLMYVGVLAVWPGQKSDFVNAKGEAWMYPDHFGSYMNVFDRGLAGWWGGWWHQTFRYAFQSGGEWTCRVLGLKQKTQAAMMTQVIVAFALSGALHAAASTTQMGETRPFLGSFMFFFLQPFGFFAEIAWRGMLKRKGWNKRAPRWLVRMANFVWVHAWFLATGPLLTDDFARGGIWLFEPLMISIFKGLGFGTPGDGWYCWNMLQSVRWAQSDRWWMTGIAV